MTFLDRIAPPLYAFPPEEMGRRTYCESSFGDKNPFPANVPQHPMWEAGWLAAQRDDAMCEHENDYLDCCDGQRELALEMAHAQFDMDIAKLRRRAQDLEAALSAKAPSIAECVARIGVPIEKWAGNCHGIASDFLAAGLPNAFETGRLVRGHWRGKVAAGTLFDHGSDFVPHSWISLGPHIVCDPTRFVFEGVDPYVYIGPDTHYDPAGQMLRLEHYAARPCPPAGPDEPLYKIQIDMDVARALDLSSTSLTKKQIFWIANLPLAVLGTAAKDVLGAIAKAGFKAFIPVDSWTEAAS